MYFVTNIEKQTLENNYYRKVIWTTQYKNMQLVLMSIPVGQDIELEVHKEADQFIRIEAGQGELHIGEHEEIKVPIKDGSALIIERNTYHRIVNVGSTPLKLYTVYTPAQHKSSEKQRYKDGGADKHKNKKKITKKVLSLFYMF